MHATGTLMSEHRVIERVIASLQSAARRLETGEAVRPGFFVDAAEFIKGYADGCHHAKEEGILFTAMAPTGSLEQSDLLKEYVVDHVQGRQYCAAMRQAAERLQAGDRSALVAVIANARDYGDLLLGHIHAEDHILFPNAEQIIPPARQEQVDEAFECAEREEVDAGLPAKYLALAEHLAGEAVPA